VPLRPDDGTFAPFVVIMSPDWHSPSRLVRCAAEPPVDHPWRGRQGHL
jgi:hypothetical protein